MDIAVSQFNFSGTKNYHWERGDGAVFGDGNVYFNIKITITLYLSGSYPDNVIGHIKVTPEDIREDITTGPTHGAGFYNGAGLTWPLYHYRKDVLFPMDDPSQDVLWYAENNMKDAALKLDGGGTDPEFFNSGHMVFGVMFNDNTLEKRFYSHIGSSWERDLKRDDLNDDGSLKPIPVMQAFKRSYDQNQHATINVGFPICLNNDEYFDPDVWEYYPWAIRQGLQWKSCNRKGGYVILYENGWETQTPDGWKLAHPVKNNLLDYSKSRGRIYSNGNWRISPLTGDY